MGNLEGKVIVVTGASRGLGEEMSLAYAREGAALVLAARTASDLERVAGACKEAGASSVSVVPTDITDEQQVQRLIDDTVGAHGRIDVFVANSGTSYANLTDKRYRELISYDLDIMKQLFEVNVFGTFTCVKCAIPAMKEGGSVIVIGSETGRALYPGAGAYAITKSVIDAMSTLLARESAQSGIRVNVLSPGGMVDTHLFGPEKMPEWLKQQHPPLPAGVIVPAAVWLASEESAPVTGAMISGKEFNAGPDELKTQLMAAAQQQQQRG